MKAYPFYLFDLDGTLLDSTTLIMENTKYTLGLKAGFVPPDDLVRRHIGIPLKEQYRIYLGDRAAEFDLDQLLDFHMEHQLRVWKDHLKLFDGVLETLDALRSRGSKVAIVTSRRMTSAKVYAEGLGIWPRIDLWVTPESSTRHKPHPEPAQVALRELGADARESLFVGDAVFDIACGTDAGCDTCYVDWGYLPASEVRPEPTWVIRKMKDLLVG